MISDEFLFVVRGVPAPKGSLKCVGRNGHHRLIDDSPNTARWRDEIVSCLDNAIPSADRHQGIGVEITTTLPRPSGHSGRRGIRPSAPPLPTMNRTGDVDKLARLVLDALQDAHVLDDDAQVVEVISRKAYPSSGWTPDALPVPGVLVRVYPMVV